MFHYETDSNEKSLTFVRIKQDMTEHLCGGKSGF